MAKFLTGRRIVGRIEEIIADADNELFLVSPYIKVDEGIKNLLGSKQRSTDIHVIYGKKRLKPEVEELFERLGIRLWFLKNLHAKLYINEYVALVTSMNLYDYSLKNNDEIGILASKADDPSIYKSAYAQVQSWLKTAVEIDATGSGGPSFKGQTLARRKRHPARMVDANQPKEGFCIRCKTGLAANLEKPYCQKHFRSWKRYKNDEYGEKFCHRCGNENGTTMRDPLCPICRIEYV